MRSATGGRQQSRSCLVRWRGDIENLFANKESARKEKRELDLIEVLRKAQNHCDVRYNANHSGLGSWKWRGGFDGT